MHRLILILFMLVIIPMIILFTNHNAFFIVVGVTLLAASLKNIHTMLFKIKEDFSQSDEDGMDDLESLVGIDLKKFGAGTRVVKNLLVILFLIYCSFFLDTFIIKILLSVLLIYRIHLVISSIMKSENMLSVKNEKVKNATIFLLNLSTIILITLVSFNKFTRFIA